VHRQTFEMPEVKQFVEELSVDGVRFASALPGNPALGKNKVRLHDLEAISIFPRQRCPDRVGQPPTACLTNHLFRDGHDGVWNIIDEIAPNGERREILDWYHLMENLHKVVGH